MAQEDDNQERDYGNTGLTIQEALVDQAKRSRGKSQRPPRVLWNGRVISTGDAVPVTAQGTVRCEILASRGDVEQGFDLKLDGWLRLADGTRVSLLRTWNDPQYEPFVEYPFHSNDGRLWLWNVYKRRQNGQILAEKWTGNAGLWVEQVSETERIYHCSQGWARVPDFESLVLRMKISSSRVP